MELIAGRVTDVFLTVSEAEAADARRRHIFANPIPIGNGRDPGLFRPDPAARDRIRAELGTPEDRVVVVAVSRLVRDKGYPELAEAMRGVPDAELWVVGERLVSDRGDDMVALLLAAGLGDRLQLLGYRHDVEAVLAAADIFTLPSYYEALPMSVIEAMLDRPAGSRQRHRRTARAGGRRAHRPAGARPAGRAAGRRPGPVGR